MATYSPYRGGQSGVSRPRPSPSVGEVEKEKARQTVSAGESESEGAGWDSLGGRGVGVVGSLGRVRNDVQLPGRLGALPALSGRVFVVGEKELRRNTNFNQFERFVTPV